MRLDIFKHMLVASLIMSLYVFTACSVDADLCDSGVHPHEGKVSFSYDWGDYTEMYPIEKIPDSMYIIATRVVNHYKTAMVVGSNRTEDIGNSGYFVYNPPVYKPMDVTPPPTSEPEPEPTPPTETEEDDKEQNGGSGNEDLTRAGDDTDDSDDDLSYMDAIHPIGIRRTEFPLRTGSYKMVTFNMKPEMFDYTKVVEYMTDPTTDKKLQDLYVEYKTYAKGEEAFKKPLPDWQDYNQYAGYVQTDVTPIFFDTIPSIEVGNGKMNCKFKPIPITQRIDIYFNIKKDFPKDLATGKDSAFAIDRVVCEMAGIPYRIDLSSGHLAIQSTRKMMFETELLTPDGQPLESDDEGYEGIVRVHATIDVPSIVQNSTPTMSTGPGIMQVMIIAHGTDPGDGTRKEKKLQGKINLYKTLERAKLITITDDGKYALRNGDHGVLDIVADVVVSGGNVIKNNDNNGGLDVWIDCNSKIIVDI